LILGGAAGLLAGAVLAVVITSALTSGTGPSPSLSRSNDSHTPKTTAKSVVSSALARQEPSGQKPTPPRAAQSRPAQSQPLGGDLAVKPAKPPEPAPLSPEQVFEQASPAVVYIVVRDKDFKPIGLGSGFFVAASGLIATNYHVIKGAEFASARLSSGATLFLDGVVAADPSGDLALLKVSGGVFPCLKIAKGGLPKVGATVYAIGNPRGLENTFSGGMVSGHREIKPGLTTIQVTTPISSGSSGGPLLNASGEVVGVTTAYLATGQNLNFAAPVSGVSALIRKQGKVQTLASAGGGRFDSAETEELDKAWAAMAKQDWATATKILTELRKTQPENPFVWFALGDLHWRLGNYEIAIEQYKQAVALKPDYAWAYGHMGYIYRNLKRPAEAIEAYKKAISIKPDYAQAHCGMGLTYMSIDRPSEAIEAYKKSISIKPDYAAAYFLVGSAYQKVRQYADSVAAYEQFLRLEPTGLLEAEAEKVRKELPELRRLAGK
jgi:S1-C subfamily serine protease/Tfp pilus assembly protein PilF